ncbi:MAG: LysM peptidoglycan-binding domain-containing protein [Chloroflexota bacterium]
MSQSNQSGKIQTYNLNLPTLLLLFLVFTLLGGGLTYLAAQITSPSEEPTPVVALPTDTQLPPTETQESAPQIVEETTPLPQPTLPPLDYTVQSGDTCAGIAGFFDISITLLVQLNNLSTSCNIFPGQVLVVPQPTPMPTSDAIATQAARLTEAACPVEVVTVQEGETIDAIANFLGVPANEILEWNGKTSSLLFAGETLEIPLCKNTTDESGSTLTPSPAPSYNAPEILQPPRGMVFSQGDTIVLQWVAPAQLRPNEYFMVTIFDNTAGDMVILEEYLQDTSFIVPESLHPADGGTHVFSWRIGIVAHIGEDSFGNRTYRQSGPDSEMYYFAWE